MNIQPNLYNVTYFDSYKDVDEVMPDISQAFKCIHDVDHYTDDDIIKLVTRENINVQDQIGDTLLHLAAFLKRHDLVRFLIENGADQLLRNSCQSLPLHAAIQGGCLDIVKLLFQKDLINAKGFENQTPLNYAVNFNRRDIVQFLLANGADRLIADDLSFTPLYNATRNGNLDIVKELFTIEHLTVNKTHKKNVLHYAVEHDHKDIVEYFIEKKRDLIYGHDCIFPPIVSACISGNEKMIELLCKKELGENYAKYDSYLCVSYVLTLHEKEKREEIFKIFKNFSPSILSLSMEIIQKSQLADAYNFAIRDFKYLGSTLPEINFNQGVSKDIFLEMLASFLKTNTHNISVDCLEFIYNTFTNFKYSRHGKIANCSDGLVSTINKGEPVLLSIGFIQHSIGLLFHKNTIILINRPYLTFFKINETTSDFTKLIQKICDMSETELTTCEFFQNNLMLEKFFQINLRFVKDLLDIEPSHPPFENSRWNNMVLGFLAAHTLHQINMNQGIISIDHSEFLIFIYRTFIVHARVYLTKKYCESLNKRDNRELLLDGDFLTDLFQSAKEKANKARRDGTNAESLEQIIDEIVELKRESTIRGGYLTVEEYYRLKKIEKSRK